MPSGRDGACSRFSLAARAQAAKTGNLLTAEQMTEAFATYFQAHCKEAANIVFKRDECMDDQIATAKRMFEAVNKEWIDYWNIQSVAEPFRVEMPGLSKPLIGELDMVITEQTPFDDENDEAPIPLSISRLPRECGLTISQPRTCRPLCSATPSRRRMDADHRSGSMS